jgi:hypothetical protein
VKELQVILNALQKKQLMLNGKNVSIDIRVPYQATDDPERDSIFCISLTMENITINVREEKTR